MFVYITSVPKINSFFEIISQVPKPPKYSTEWAIRAGVKKDSNTGRFTKLLEEMKLIDDEGTPTALWDSLRGDKSEAIGIGVKNAYSTLFTLLGDPCNPDKRDIVEKNFYTEMSDKDKRVIRYAINTFYTLCEMGSLTTEIAQAPVKQVIKGEKVVNNKENPPLQRIGLPEISINLQIVLPENATPKTYDDIFASLSKFIYGEIRNEK